MAMGCLAGYIGLGWAVWSGQGWLLRAVGSHKYQRLYRSYENVAVGLFPGDRDGDGACDGLEYFRGTDANSASNHPSFHLFLEGSSAFVAHDARGYFGE